MNKIIKKIAIVTLCSLCLFSTAHAQSNNYENSSFRITYENGQLTIIIFSEKYNLVIYEKKQEPKQKLPDSSIEKWPCPKYNPICTRPD